MLLAWIERELDDYVDGILNVYARREHVSLRINSHLNEILLYHQYMLSKR